MTTPAAPIPTPDADEHKGAVEQDSRDQESNTTLNGQMQHREGSPLADYMDSDFPEPGGSPEHTGQLGGSEDEGSPRRNPDPHSETRKHEQNPETQDPGDSQKENQNQKKDDPLAA
jgi:hypothetical protein